MKIQLNMPDMISQGEVHNLLKANKKNGDGLVSLRLFYSAMALIPFLLTLIGLGYTQNASSTSEVFASVYFKFNKAMMFSLADFFIGGVLYLVVLGFVGAHHIHRYIYKNKISINYDGLDVYSWDGKEDLYTIGSKDNQRLLTAADSCLELLTCVEKDNEEFFKIKNAITLLEKIKQEGRTAYMFESRALDHCFKGCEESLLCKKNDRLLEDISQKI